MKYAINGKFLSQGITGVQRYAREILIELDKTITKDEMCIVYAGDAKDIPNFKNIKCIKKGKKCNFIWLQITFPNFCSSNKLMSINLCNYGPLINPGVVCLHDIGIMHHPNFASKKFYYWTKIQNWNSVHRAKGLITVSNFSKKDIEDYYAIAKNRLVVIPSAWQHMKRVLINENIFNKYKYIIKNQYYFSMASISPNKNIKWIIETARLNLDEVFVVAGKTDKKIFGNINSELPPNVHLLGYITDDEAKSLFKNCKAFIFPSFFEGFGTPPLEALACGCNNIIISDTECMKEVYEDIASYINPQIPCKNINQVINTKDKNKILEKYSWRKSALLLKKYLEENE